VRLPNISTDTMPAQAYAILPVVCNLIHLVHVS
jgi:hypothetical protein